MKMSTKSPEILHGAPINLALKENYYYFILE